MAVSLFTNNILNPTTLPPLPGLDLIKLTEITSSFFLSSIRIAAFLLSSPLFGARYVLLPVRILISMTLAIVVFNNLPSNFSTDMQNLDLPNLLVLIFKEIAIGLTGGLILTIWFSAAGLAGEKIATSCGLGYAMQVDPSSGTSSPVISQILTLFLIVIFISIDGHLIILRILLDSYELIPIGANLNLGVMVANGISAAGSMFLAATIIMLPIAGLTLMINIAIGVVTRSAPTLNLFSFGFPITMIGAFVILYFSTNSLAFSFSDLINEAIETFQIYLEDVANG